MSKLSLRLSPLGRAPARPAATRTLVGALALCLSGFACKQASEQSASPNRFHPHPDHSAAVFTNGGFEDGTLNGWSVSTGSNNGASFTYPANSTADLHLVAGGSNLSGTVTGSTGTVIPAGLTSASTLRLPKFGAYSAVVNKQGASYNSNTLTQTATMTSADVDAADGNIHIRFAVAPVLQNPGHPFAQQPYYYVQVVNQTRGITLASTLHYSNEPGVPWKSDPGAAGVLYTDWQTFDVAPGSSQLDVGDVVTVTLVATGCAQGGHWGEVYLDAFGSRIPGLSVQARVPNAVNAGSNLVYSYAVANGGTAAGTNVIVTQPIPANLTFTSVDVSSIAGAVCTAPAAGATSGTISCNLGTLSAASNQNFTITFGVPATVANNTVISNGSYAVQGDGIAPLIGPATSSTVTTGVTYADLGITGTDGKAAVLFGDPDTYTITVVNNGPTSVVAAPVSVPIPAQLTSASWTCTATAGTCGAASGTGAIATTVSLTQGGQAVFLLSGTIIAGSGSSSIRLTGSVATPGGVTDPVPSNNTFSDTDSIGSLDTVTVTKSGNGAGRVVSSPAAIDCGSACTSASAKFLDGSQVSFTATPNANQLFGGWTSGCSGATNPCTLTLASSVTVTASFLDLPAPAISAVSPAQGVAGTTVTISGSNFQAGATVLLNGTAATVASVTATTITFTVPAIAPGAYDVKVINPDGKSATLANGFVYLAPSSVALSSSAPSQSYAAPVTFTATVTGNGTPTGTVTFFDGGASLGTGTLQGGSATLTTSGLAVGSHSITASYGGDAAFAAATSGALAQTIVRGTPSIALTASPGAPVFGQAETLTANVTGTGGTPSGSVTFFNGTTSLGTAPLASGTATLSLSTLPVGSDSITAVYSGDASFAPATSAAQVVTVGPAGASVAVSASPTSQTFGAAVTVTATVSAVGPGSGTPDGSVTFYDGATSLGSVALAGGTASLSTSTLAVGTHSLSASYSGSANFRAASSGPAAETITKASPAVALATAPSSPVRGQAVQLTATVTGPGATPSGAVTFFDGGTSLGAVTLSGGAATLSVSTLAVGSHAITARYGGDGNFVPAASPSSSVAVQKASTSASLKVSPSPSTFGAAVSLQATVAAVSPGAGTPDGTVTFFDNGASLGSVTLSAGAGALSVSTLAVGAHSITASYSGSADFTGAASAPTSQTVGKATPSVALLIGPASPVFGQQVTVTATVAGPGATPTGLVTLSDGGVAIGSATLVNGAVTFTTSSLAAGAHSLVAAYGGDGNFLAANSPASALTVQQASTATALNASPQPSSFGGAVTLTATVSAVAPGAGVPSGTVTFSDGNNSIGTATLAGGTATLSISTLAVGAHSLTASYAGDASFLASVSPPTPQTVNQAQPAVTLAASPTSTVFGQGVTLTATATGPGATPTGTITFLDGTTSLGTGTLQGGVATLQIASLAVGAHSLSASYGGDGNFVAAASSAVSFTVGQAASASTLVAAPTPSVAGQSVTLTAGVAAVMPGAGVPSGQLTFMDGAATLHTSTLDTAGTATFSTSALAVGPHALTVVYAGDTNFTGSTSAAYNQSVGQAATTLVLTTDQAAPVFGQPVHYTATVAVTAPGTGVATQTVTFTDGKTTLGTATLDAAGVARFTDASLSPGPHTVAAAYAGDKSFTGSSGTVLETVGLASSAAVLAVAPNPSTYGAAVSLRVTVTAVAPGAGAPGGTVTFFDGAAAIGTATLTQSTASLSRSDLLAGAHVLKAVYGGDGNFNPSTTAPATLVVNRAASAAASTPSPAASVTGQAVTFKLVVTSPGGVPTGKISLYDGPTTGTPIGAAPLVAGAAVITVSFAHAGTHPLVAVYSGDANFLGSASTPAGYPVTPAATAVAVSASPAQTLVNRPISFFAEVSSTAPGSGTPRGTITFADAGRALGAVALDALGTASLTVPSLGLGNHPITASYAGSADFLSSQGALAGGEAILKSAPVAGSGSAVLFDGATQAASVANADGALDGVQSVEVEFNRADSDVARAPACLVQQGEGSATVFGLCLTASRDGIEVRRGADVRDVAVALGPGWHQLALVGGDSTLLFVDGLQVASMPGGFGAGRAQPLLLAAAPAGTGRTDRFAGALDEVRLWSAPRAATAVQADLQRPVAPDATSLLALWRLDEGSGAALYDAASRHAVAALEGAPAWIASEAWKARTTPEERPLAAFTAGYDPDGAPVTVTLMAAAPHGAATASADQVGYLPAQGFLGTDAFTYSVSNGQSSSSPFTTSVAVTHIDVCSVQADCGGGDLCTNSVCVGPAALSTASGGCSSLPSSGPSTALLPIVLLAGLLLLRRRSPAPRPAARGAALLFALLGAAQARAADGFALDTFEPSPVGDHFFQIPDADVSGHLTPAFGLEAGWAHEPLTLYSNGTPLQRGKLVQNQYGLRLGGALPLLDRVLLDADLGVSAYQQGQTPFNGVSSLSATAFHDPRLGARVALLRGDRLAIAAGLSVFLPLGSQSGYGSDGTIRALPQLLASGRVGQVIYASEAGLELRKTSDASFTRTSSAARLGLAAGWMFLQDRLQVGPELFSRVQLDDAAGSSVEALLGARYQRGDFGFGLGAGGRLDQHAPGAAPLRVVAQLTFTGFDFLHARSQRPPQLVATAVPTPAPAPAPAPVAPTPAPAPVAPAPAPAPAPVVVAAAAPVAPLPLELPPPAAATPDADVQIVDGKIELRHTLRFAHASSVLDDASKRELDQVAEVLRNKAGPYRVFIAGHSDNHGTRSYNDRLTAQRARAVRTELQSRGVPAASLHSRGCGSLAPVASNETDEGRSRNRRVELLLTPPGVEPGCAP